MRTLPIVIIGIGVAIMLWVAFSEFRLAFDGFRIAREWRPLSPPYEAHVIGFADRGGVRTKVTAPTVAIRFPDGSKKEFTSSRSGAFHLLGVLHPVQVLTRKEAMFGQQSDVYEIDNSFHLWIKDAIFGAAVIGLLIGIPFFAFFRPFRFMRR